ncbi:Y-family DNA polymerase [Spirosoma terrae]|uniref:Y-family DNA polymerase n=1 Tax=Spirosoma terrae TaxID=1968276 RepID=A0A6L9L5K9_9BACT|nr:Y-family DNA polymerase [Spirosoma terrae]
MIGIADCNNFYASCERVFNPALEGKPVVVLSNNDGCIVARSNESKALKIKMGEPIHHYKELVKSKGVHVLSSNYELYGDMSARIMRLLNRFVPVMEVYSIDEAFLDLTGFDDVVSRCHSLQRTLKAWTGIPISIGVGPNKTLAKVANRIAKQTPSMDGVLYLSELAQIQAALADFPCEDVWGIGYQFNQLLKRNNIKTALELTQVHDVWIQKHMTIDGLRLVDELRGNFRRDLDLSPSPKKSIGSAPSFGEAIPDLPTIQEALATHVARCAEKLRRQYSAANLITVFLHTNRFNPKVPQYFQTRTVSLPHASSATSELIQYADSVLQSIYQDGYHFKKVGVLLSGFVPDDFHQMALYTEQPDPRMKQLSNVMDQLNGKYGRDKVRLAIQGFKQNWKPKRQLLTKRYTTRIEDVIRAT